MASKSIIIDNIYEAIKTKVIPGSFSKDLTIFTFPIIYYQNKRENTLEWTIEIKLKKNNEYIPIRSEMIEYPVYNLDSTYIAEINIISNQVEGKIRKAVPTLIKEGKNMGKKNETNAITQAFREALYTYNKKLHKTNTSNDKPLPMLLQSINSSKKALLTAEDFTEGITIQKKFNGVRYVSYLNKPANTVIQYSRTGIDYHPAEYLQKDLMYLLTNLPKIRIGTLGITSYIELYNDPYLDGELYLHGKTLSYISGQARKENDKEELDYYIFDVFFPHAIAKGFNMISKHRQEYLELLFRSTTLNHVKKVGNYHVQNIDYLNMLAKQFISEGYEGAIARKYYGIYEYSYNGYHSPNVLKIKPVYSSEFKVVDFTEGTTGKDSGKIIWICEVEKPIDPRDRYFSVVPNMSLENRGKLYRCLSKYVDKKTTRFERDVKNMLLTIEYAELSAKTGKPLQAKAIAFRTYESKDDPIKSVYKECNISE